jgi:hypothetical protein
MTTAMPLIFNKSGLYLTGGERKSQKMGNQFRTAVLLTVMTAFFMFVGQLLGGRQGMIIALILPGA